LTIDALRCIIRQNQPNTSLSGWWSYVSEI
jgi:hypothetical protein